MSDQTPKRILVFDTETTGFNPIKGDRLLEIGMIEVLDYGSSRTVNRLLHAFIDPGFEVPESAFEVHGTSRADAQRESLTMPLVYERRGDEDVVVHEPGNHPLLPVTDTPRTFADIAPFLIDFIGDATLVAHNAEFDMRFMNYELSKAGYPLLGNGYGLPGEMLYGDEQGLITCGHPAIENPVVDTLAQARSLHPRMRRHTLDALATYYRVERERDLHGALLDTEILVDVYIQMTSQQATLKLSADTEGNAKSQSSAPQRQSALPRNSKLAAAPELPVVDADQDAVRADQSLRKERGLTEAAQDVKSTTPSP